MIFTGKNILIVGTGISGMGALKALSTVQANCILYDGNENLGKEDIMKKLELDYKDLKPL